MKKKTIKIKVTPQDLDFVWSVLEFTNDQAREKEDEYAKIKNKTDLDEMLRSSWEQVIKDTAEMMERIELKLGE